jgi:hypothetical protein
MGPLPIPQTILEWMWSSGGMILTGKNRRTRRKICLLQCHLSTTNPTFIALGAKPGLRLYYSTAFSCPLRKVYCNVNLHVWYLNDLSCIPSNSCVSYACYGPLWSTIKMINRANGHDIGVYTCPRINCLSEFYTSCGIPVISAFWKYKLYAINGCVLARRLDAGSSPQRPGFSSRAVHMGFVVDSGTGTVSSPNLSVFPDSIIPPPLHIHSCIIWGMDNGSVNGCS